MKKLISVLLLTLAAFTTHAQTFLENGLAAPTFTDSDSSTRELRRKYDPIDPRNNGIWGVRLGKDSMQLSITPYGVRLIERDSNTVIRAAIRAKLDTSATITASKIGSGTLATGRIPQLPISKITDLTGTLASKADLVDGKVPLSQLSAVVISDVFVVNTQAAMLSLSAERGDIAIRSDLSKTFVLSTDSPTTLADWKELPTPTAAVSSVAGKTGAVTLVKGDVGLGNVDNTSDASKPVSTATQTALDARATVTALSSHTSNTSNPHSVTKTQVGLGNVDNTSDASKPVSSATQTALDLKANTVDLPETIDDRVGGLIVAGPGITKNYDDGTGELTLSATASTAYHPDEANFIALSTVPLSVVTGDRTLTSATVFSSRVRAPVSATCTHAMLHVAVVASSVSGGSAGNAVAVYDLSGNQLGLADFSGQWTSTGAKKVAYPSSFTITAGTEYFISVTATASTAPQIRAGSSSASINANISSAPYRFQFRSTTMTNPLSPTTSQGADSGARHWVVGCATQ